MLIYRFFVRRLTLFLEVTGSFDECLSVANEKGWERKLPLIRSLRYIFVIECHCSWFSQKQGTQGVREAGVVQLGAWWLALAYPCLCLGTLSHPCSWADWCFLGHTSPGQQRPLLSEDSPADAVLLVFQPMFAKHSLFLWFVSLLGLAGNEPLSWPAASSGRKAAKRLPAENTVC